MHRKILFYGDSNTYGYDPADMYEKRFPWEQRWTTILQEELPGEWEVLPDGMNGRRIPDLSQDRERIERRLSLLSKGDLLAVMLGTNDIVLSMDPDAGQAIDRMNELLHFLTLRKESREILIIAPVPFGATKIRDPLYSRFRSECLRMNRAFGMLAETFGTRFVDAGAWEIDLSYDLVHFSEKGHRQFAEKMGAYMKEMTESS